VAYCATADGSSFVVSPWHSLCKCRSHRLMFIEEILFHDPTIVSNELLGSLLLLECSVNEHDEQWGIISAASGVPHSVQWCATVSLAACHILSSGVPQSGRWCATVSLVVCYCLTFYLLYASTGEEERV
jgi:hypothetical protein